MLNEVGELPVLRKHTLQELMQDYEAVQQLFYPALTGSPIGKG